MELITITNSFIFLVNLLNGKQTIINFNKLYSSSEKFKLY
mgnify:CR=1 FL=1